MNNLPFSSQPHFRRRTVTKYTLTDDQIKNQGSDGPRSPGNTYSLVERRMNMAIVSTQGYLRKIVAALLIVLTLQSTAVVLSGFVPVVEGVYAAECEDGTCG